MRRREFLKTAPAAAALAGWRCAGTDDRPNVLWILAEDFSRDLGCYGNDLVQTPNLDALASEGVRYTQCICTAPVCSAARSALMTGMFQTSIGAHNHRSHRDVPYDLAHGVRTVTGLFREAGYFTANCTTPADGVRVGGKTDFNFHADRPFDGQDWAARPAGAPFYAQVNLPETHRRFRRFRASPVDPEAIDLAPYYPDHPVVREDVALYLDTAQHLDVKVGRVLQRLKDEGLYDSTIIFFFADHGQALHRGKQWLYEQGIAIPLIVRIPERYRPVGFSPGSSDDQLLQHIDITTTSLCLAGIAPAESMQGRVFLGPDAGPEPDYAFSARDRCDETVDRIRCVRGKRYKLIRNFLPERPYSQTNHYKDTSYPALQVMRQLHAEGSLQGPPALWMAPSRPDLELYDLESDPHEVVNLAEDARHAEILEELQVRLNEWIESSNDHGRVREDPIPGEYALRTMVDGWHTNRGVLSRTPAGLSLNMDSSGRREADIMVPWVALGGPLRLELALRSEAPVEFKVRWGTPVSMGGQGEHVVRLSGGGALETVDVDFECDGWLTWFGLRFGEGRTAMECRSVRLLRRDERVDTVIREWSFT